MKYDIYSADISYTYIKPVYRRLIFWFAYGRQNIFTPTISLFHLRWNKGSIDHNVEDFIKPTLRATRVFLKEVKRKEKKLKLDYQIRKRK